jgi:spermidine synthase
VTPPGSVLSVTVSDGVEEPAPGSTPVLTGSAELLADADRPGGWLLLVDRIRQSYVDLDDPTYLDFEYLQMLADLVDALPAGPLAVVHVGGGAFSFPRYVAATRPGSQQIAFEPDTALTAMVRARLPLPRQLQLKVRPLSGRDGVAGLPSSSVDVLVLDAFLGGRVPAELTTAEFFAQVARVLRSDGVVLANLADGPPLRYCRQVAATVRGDLPHVVLVADPAVLRGRRFGNVVLGASRATLPLRAAQRAAAAAAFPRKVLHGAELTRFVSGSRRLTDAQPARSPQPPDEMWRVGEA